MPASPPSSTRAAAAGGVGQRAVEPRELLGAADEPRAGDARSWPDYPPSPWAAERPAGPAAPGSCNGLPTPAGDGPLAVGRFIRQPP